MKLSKSKIAIITATIGTTTETFVSRHINHLNNGDTVVLCKRDEVDAKAERPVHCIRPAWWYKYPSPIRKLIQLPHYLRYRETRVPDLKERKNIQHFLKKEKVTSILAEFGPHGCMIQPVAEEIGIPVYTYFRGVDASKRLYDWRTRHAYRKMIPKMAGLFAVSPHLLENLKNIGVKWKQAHVIPSGTDTHQFKPGVKDPNLVLSVGRFVKKKAPNLTLHAFAEVVGKRPDLQLVMVGEGVMLKECKSLAASLGIEKNVTFTGAQPNHVVQNYMAKASLFLLHSVTDDSGNTEGFPSVIQEAMASGCVVVSTKHGGIPYFIENGENAFLVNEFDLNSYVQVIDNILKDPILQKMISNKARGYASLNFDYKKLFNKVESTIL